MLKWMALFFMLIDHFAFTFQESIQEDLYWTLRVLGRLSFPVFVYYVVLGLDRTSNVNKYLWRLFIFASISEIFKRMFYIFQDDYFNVMFSFFIYGVIYMLLLNKNSSDSKVIKSIGALLIIVIIVPFLEYGYSGFLLFCSLYVVHHKIKHNKRIFAVFLIALSFVPTIIHTESQFQLFAALAGFLMFSDSLDKRMFSPRFEKWSFYFIYPVQWLIFGIIYYSL